MLFEDLIVRAAEPTLHRIVGKSSVRLLSKLEPELLQPSALSEVAVDLTPPVELLLNPDTRAELMPLLRTHEATELAEVLGLDVRDPYSSLEDLRIRRGSKRASKLLDFFTLADSSQEDAATPATIESIGPMHGLFDHQRAAARKVIGALSVDPGRVLLHMPTGSGKTRTAMNIIAQWLTTHEPCLVVWLAHSEELCEQAVQEFCKTWEVLGNREVKVARWWGEHSLEDDIIDGVVVAGLPKVYSAARSSFATVGNLAGRVQLIVMDEAHQAIAPTYEFILGLLSQAGVPTPLLGLTATPGRTWNDIDEDERLADFFFRRRVQLEVKNFDNAIDYLVSEGYLAKASFSSLHYSSGAELTPRDLDELSDALDIPERIVRMLADDEQRNLVIVHRVEQMVQEHRRIIVFAATVQHARLLATVLRARGIWARSITGVTPIQERRRLISEFRSEANDARVVVNYGVLTTGFDAPNTSGALIARPTKSLVLYSQMVGRATRGPRAGGNERAEVVTVVDTALPGFASMADAFHNWEDIW
ncbi:DEAD/DEAH box helicase [Hoyosella subflava]|uniref:Type III restriction enzyme, res subunit n=1 Tax=Hoyosella subflava (strain DSM 45089 / JCM 17490 / NBRC 109087 / DQS3-9A1) TaxID=443218 RepID=F6EJ44_HOYSD|nr:DEAD/DEAH box helicase [Hoyosella subflava]AEF41276.1 Type III restriction enzyme, res subunit [Hoyosella subflava DQS3-9A1]